MEEKAAFAEMVKNNTGWIILEIMRSLDASDDFYCDSRHRDGQGLRIRHGW